MFGKTRHGRAYYSCYPANNNADQLARYGDHPKSIYVREDALLDGVGTVLAGRVFGPDRLAHYQAGIKAAPSAKAASDAQRAAALQHSIEDLTARQDRLLAQLETADPDDRAFTNRIRSRFAALEAERTSASDKLDELEKTLTAQPTHDVELLDAVPLLKGLDITTAPEPIQRKRYDALRLEVHYQRPDHAHIKITLTEPGVHALAALQPADAETRAYAPRTPPGIRTCDKSRSDRAAQATCTHLLLTLNPANQCQLMKDQLSRSQSVLAGQWPFLTISERSAIRSADEKRPWVQVTPPTPPKPHSSLRFAETSFSTVIV
jgi:hypothetical protein